MAEMSAKEYLEAKKRMTQNCNVTCDKCPLSKRNNGSDKECEDLQCDYPDKAIAIVQKWAEEHPKKTRLTEFLKLFPYAMIDDGFPQGCWKFYDERAAMINCAEQDCTDCIKEFWNEEIKDDE